VKDHILRECREYGIDPSDAKYRRKDRVWPEYPQERCQWCLSHERDRPRVYCDLQMAKAERIYAEGNSVGECWCCHALAPVEEMGGTPRHRVRFTCGTCEDRPPLTPYEPDVSRGRQADGKGCVEKLSRVEAALIARDGGFG
jgi:hypothetical protein